MRFGATQIRLFLGQLGLQRARIVHKLVNTTPPQIDSFADNYVPLSTVK